MDYGNTIDNTVKPLGLVLGIFAGLFPLTIVGGHLIGGGKLTDLNIWVVLGAPVFWLVVMFICVLATFICIRLCNDVIQVVLLKRYVLREEKINDLVAIEAEYSYSRGNCVVLTFRNGRKIRKYSPPQEVQRLAEDLEKATNGTIKVNT
jgi:hypothetical protein